MTAIQTTRLTTSPSTAVLARLAERWRSTGLFLACFAPDGNLLWHDSHMPRAMSLCATSVPALPTAVRTFNTSPAPAMLTPFPGLQVHLTPLLRRRKLHAWLAVLARVDIIADCEDLQRAAARANLDVPALLLQVQRAPAIHAPLLPPLVELVSQMHDDLQAAATAHQELTGVTEELSGAYEEINLLYKISAGMRFARKPGAFLESICHDMQCTGGFRAVALCLTRRDDDPSEPVPGDLAACVGECSLTGHELINALYAPITAALKAGEPQIHNDLAAASDYARLHGALQRFVCVPLMRDKRPLGALLVVDKQDQTDFTSVDLKLLTNVAGQCAIFLENANLYQDTQDLFMGVLHALTRSIDAKDAYTRGHSQRVAELSRALAVKIGLSEHQCERIYLSGLLHDVGKIGVPESVLTKPGRLTDAEFEAIKKHPAIGAQILGNIKQLQDIIPGVLYHHERWDGRGYPHQIGGENIPLMGRIICVADSFDAMSSTRTYRPALPLDTVLAEIARCSGTQFDPALAKVFMTLDFSGYCKAVNEQLEALRLQSLTAPAAQ